MSNCLDQKKPCSDILDCVISQRLTQPCAYVTCIPLKLCKDYKVEGTGKASDFSHGLLYKVKAGIQEIEADLRACRCGREAGRQLSGESMPEIEANLADVGVRMTRHLQQGFHWLHSVSIAYLDTHMFQRKLSTGRLSLPKILGLQMEASCLSSMALGSTSTRANFAHKCNETSGCTLVYICSKLIADVYNSSSISYMRVKDPAPSLTKHPSKIFILFLHNLLILLYLILMYGISYCWY